MMGEPLAVLGALASGVTAALAVGLVARPPRRLGPRVRPYAIVSRTSLGRSADVLAGFPRGSGGPVASLVRPMVESLALRLGRVIDPGGEESLILRLHQSGLYDHLPPDQRLAGHRLRQVAGVGVATGGSALLAVTLGMPAARALVVTALGLVVGVTRQRGRVDRAIEDRRMRMRIEIYTVNQLLAIRVRAGGGVVQAVQQLVARGSGQVVGELSEALRLHRSGMRASEAFGRAARLTPEAHCARTYALIAAVEERGADLAQGLLALAEDVREARREALRRTATRRRAAMLVPTIAILAPIMLLFVGAPLPYLVLNWR
ncbi:MAG: type II secretion system F family protein [Acidimicrobiia bacterium]